MQRTALAVLGSLPCMHVVCENQAWANMGHSGSCGRLSMLLGADVSYEAGAPVSRGRRASLSNRAANVSSEAEGPLWAADVS